MTNRRTPAPEYATKSGRVMLEVRAGGGDVWGLTGFGAHAFDQVLWGLGRETEPPVAVRVHKPGDPNCAVTPQGV